MRPHPNKATPQQGYTPSKATPYLAVFIQTTTSPLWPLWILSTSFLPEASPSFSVFQIPDPLVTRPPGTNFPAYSKNIFEVASPRKAPQAILHLLCVGVERVSGSPAVNSPRAKSSVTCLFCYLQDFPLGYGLSVFNTHSEPTRKVHMWFLQQHLSRPPAD